jgi:copper chaperone
MKNETVLKVEGMTCHSCVAHVGGALRDVDGVGEVQVEFKLGQVRVSHDPERANLTALVEALRDAGYESRPAA